VTDTPTTDTPDTRVPESWIYIGRRWGSDGSLSFRYLDASGAELIYGKQIAGTAVGARYEVKVDRSDGKIRVTPGAYRFLSDAADPRAADWRALDAAAGAMKDAAAREKSARAGQLLTLTLADLKASARKMPAPQRRALAATVLEIILGR